LPFVAIAAAAGALYFFARKKRFAASVRFELKQIKLQGSNVIAKIGVLNPSNEQAVIKSVLGTLYYNGKAIATVKNFKATTVRAASESDLEMIFVPSLVGVLSSLADLVGTKKVKGFKIVGSALVDGVLVPLNFAS
jgi:hypothetical protein